MRFPGNSETNLAVGGRVDAILVVHEIRNDFKSNRDWLISNKGLSHFIFIKRSYIDAKSNSITKGSFVHNQICNGHWNKK